VNNLGIFPRNRAWGISLQQIFIRVAVTNQYRVSRDHAIKNWDEASLKIFVVNAVALAWNYAGSKTGGWRTNPFTKQEVRELSNFAMSDLRKYKKASDSQNQTKPDPDLPESTPGEDYELVDTLKKNRKEPEVEFYEEGSDVSESSGSVASNLSALQKFEAWLIMLPIIGTMYNALKSVFKAPVLTMAILFALILIAIGIFVHYVLHRSVPWISPLLNKMSRKWG
jgi:hypothetical protein